MNDTRLHLELATVSRRYRRLLLLAGMALCWAALAVGGIAVLARVRGAGLAFPGVAVALMVVVPLAVLPFLLRGLRKVRDPLWVARRIEQKFPDLDARLLAALEQKPADPATGHLSYLQHTVINEAVDHARARRWEQVVPARTLRATGWAHTLALTGFAVVLAVLIADVVRRPGQAGFWAGGPTVPPAALTLKVEPEDTSVERGTSLIVLARFEGDKPPPDAKLLVRGPDGQPREVQMSKSLDDPVFAGRVPSVDADLTYAVRYGSEQTRWYKAAVFEHPELKQADAKLTFPTYTNAPEKVVEDTRSVTAVEGTKATLTFRLNKAVTQATLVPGAPRNPSTNPAEPAAAPQPVTLTADPTDPSVYTATIDMKQSAQYRLQLTDDAGRESKRPAELAVNVVANRPPDLKLDFPAKDVDVSALEELTVRAKVWDDFGVKRVGMSYSMAGQPAQDVVLAENLAAKDRKELAHSVLMEKLGAQPDQLLSYYFWAEDHAADGSIRRTAGDMFFAEVRPFEEIFRQGEQPPEGEQQQQSQQSSQNAQQAEEVAESQKQIIAATWNVIRRETSATPSPKFVPDVKLIAESQVEAREKAEAMAEKLTDVKSKAYLTNVLKHMETAAAELTKSAVGPEVGRLTSAALPAEQAAYQELLKLRAREHEVVRGNRRQRGQQSASSASSRRQRQLDQLKLDNEQNRYEQQRTAQQQNEAPQERETRQVLNRLRELAQRQEDLNRQMKELQSALDEAKEQAKKEEIQRQLARLREQQREQLRDTDELRDRMDQPENQERMADARQQMEQTREDVRKASESLEQGKVPEASAAGTRAGERLDNLREEFRRTAAGQFNDAVDRMRQEARELDQKQQELTQQLAESDGPPQARQPRQPGQPGQPQGQQPRGQQPQRGSPRAQGGQPQAGQPGRPEAGSEQADGQQPGSLQAGDPQAGGQPAGTSPQRQRPPSLRGPGGGREQVAQDLQEQKKRLEQLLENMRKTTEEAETAEPLLAKQLYDAIRETNQQRTGEAIDATRQLAERGFVNEAKQAGDEAAKGVTKLREGVEQAARGVLGDETEALRRARAELDGLAQELEREMGRAGRAGAPGTQPADAGAGDGQLARNNPTTGPAADAAGGEQPGQGGEAQARGSQNGDDPQEAGRQAGDAERNAAGQDGQRQARGGNGATRPSNPQLADAGSQRQPGSRQPGEGQEGQPQDGQQPGQQANGQQPEGQQPGGQQPGGRQPGGRQPGQQQAGGQQPGGQRGSPQNGQGNQPGGQQPGGQQSADAGQGDPQSPGGQQPDEGQGQGQAQGEPGQQPSGAQAGNQPGRQGQPGGQRQGGGLRQGNNDPRQPGDQQQAGGPRRGGSREDGGLRGREPGAPIDEGGERGVFTGDNFRQWSDRLRDVEEMVGDPRLRAEAARIRERAKAARAEADRHSKEPNWDVVRMSIGLPLAELRAAVNDELRRRDPSEAALVPIDRDPVPPEYAEQVRRYYERLGSGK